MPKRLGVGALIIKKSLKEIEELCDQKELKSYEKEIIIRIYWYHQNLTFIADVMDFKRHGKSRSHYSVRSINNFHKQAFLKIIKK
jgi:hypothetical protein